jgi:hypothetical protein
MLNKIIKYSLNNRLFVLLGALLLIVGGLYTAGEMDVDVFPDLTAPTVAVMTDAHGMSAEEVERLVTFHIETSVNGATDVRRVRSASREGIVEPAQVIFHGCRVEMVHHQSLTTGSSPLHLLTCLPGKERDQSPLSGRCVPNEPPLVINKRGQVAFPTLIRKGKPYSGSPRSEVTAVRQSVGKSVSLSWSAGSSPETFSWKEGR